MDPEILAYYDRGLEADRLAAGQGYLELLRTRDILRRVLPPPPARVLDVGGATGGYASWLAGLGYVVRLMDPVPAHVDAAAGRGLDAVLADARALPEPDRSADAVLLLGPLYHLIHRADRLAALREAARVVRPGGVVAAAAISRFASMHDALTRPRTDDPDFIRIVRDDLATGVHRNPGRRADYFTTAYFHQPDELAEEVRTAGLVDVRVRAVEGPAGWSASSVEPQLRDPQRREAVLALTATVEEEPSLLGASPHLLATASRPRAAG